MKMSGRVSSCCVALFFALTSVSAVQRVRSIRDLKKINFGQSVPKHSLLLLHWFANTVDIEDNVIRLNFDPNRGDYGSHEYHNSERVLDPLPVGNVRYRYYTIGNLHQETSMPLPSYVVRPQTEYAGSNSDRIIVRVREQNTGWRAWQWIDQVYITQHYTSGHQGTRYDPAHTYRITTNLLRDISEFSVGENQQSLLQLRNRYRSSANVSHMSNTWGDLACLGLLLFIVIQERSSSNQQNNRRENRQNNWPNDDSESKSNVPQSDCVVDFNDDVPENNERGSWGCFALCVIVLFIFAIVCVFFKIL